jgi:F-type H+-transporting ATPase subunit b
MRKLVLLLLLAGSVFAAEQAGEKKEAPENLTAKWINFAILAGGLGFIAVKVGGPAFRAKKQAILNDMEAAAGRAEAAAREAAEIDQKMAGLQAEVAALRVEAQQQMAAEAVRVREETAQHVEKLNQAAQHEIASATKHAQQQLKAQAAELALDLAAKKIAARVDDSVQATLVDRFTRSLNN